MQDGITCLILRTLEELNAVAPAWRDLWLEDPNAAPFQSPEWLLPWARQFKPTDLRTVVVYDRRSPVAILPFYRYLDPQTGERQLLLLGAGTSHYLDGIYSASCTISHIRKGLSLLCCEDGWDTLRVFQLPEHSKLRKSLDQLPLPGLRRIAAETCSRIPAVPLAKLPRSIRQQARYYQNLAARSGRLQLASADESNWHRAFEDLERLHTKRWQEAGQTGLLADPRVPAWHHEALPLLLRSGQLRLCTLTLDGETIAALYSLLDPPRRAHRTQYFYLTAYSTCYAKLRAGTVLTAMAIERATQEGSQTVDFLRGNEAYKRLWHPGTVPTFGFSMPHLKRSAAILDGEHTGRLAA